MLEFYGQNRTRADVRAKILSRQKHKPYIVLRIKEQWCVMPAAMFVGTAI